MLDDQQHILAESFGHESAQELEDAFCKIEHCVNQLDNAQVWWRPTESMNSIANVMTHLGGNLRQWIISGVGGEPDKRQRSAEFTRRDNATKETVLRELREVVDETKVALQTINAEDVVRPRRIQGYDVTGVAAIMHSVAHFRGHSQEIVFMTRYQIGDAYVFDFVPTTAEQGAQASG